MLFEYKKASPKRSQIRKDCTGARERTSVRGFVVGTLTVRVKGPETILYYLIAPALRFCFLEQSVRNGLAATAVFGEFIAPKSPRKGIAAGPESDQRKFSSGDTETR